MGLGGGAAHQLDGAFVLLVHLCSHIATLPAASAALATLAARRSALLQDEDRIAGESIHRPRRLPAVQSAVAAHEFRKRLFKERHPDLSSSWLREERLAALGRRRQTLVHAHYHPALGLPVEELHIVLSAHVGAFRLEEAHQ